MKINRQKEGKNKERDRWEERKIQQLKVPLL
jgi:hypothetical protein